MSEKFNFYLLVLGLAILLAGFLWLVVRAFKQRLLWGLGVLIFPPAGLLFIPLHFRKVVGPFLLLLLGGAVFATPFALSYYERHRPLRPHEKMVNGELHVTLTQLEDFDYSTLQSRRDVVVLQMANPDVTDQTLAYLKGMDQLRYLDISGSQVTDEGLRTLAELPRLQELHLARTRITDAGFQKHLGPKESLLKLNLTGVDVKGKTKRDWKGQKPQQREYDD